MLHQELFKCQKLQANTFKDIHIIDAKQEQPVAMTELLEKLSNLDSGLRKVED
jgi:hypothetical protein